MRGLLKFVFIFNGHKSFQNNTRAETMFSKLDFSVDKKSHLQVMLIGRKYALISDINLVILHL